MSRLARSTMTLTCSDVTMTWLHSDPISSRLTRLLASVSILDRGSLLLSNWSWWRRGLTIFHRYFSGSSQSISYMNLIPINQTCAKYFLSLSCPITGPGQSSDQWSRVLSEITVVVGVTDSKISYCDKGDFTLLSTIQLPDLLNLTCGFVSTCLREI